MLAQIIQSKSDKLGTNQASFSKYVLGKTYHRHLISGREDIRQCLLSDFLCRDILARVDYPLYCIFLEDHVSLQ